MLQTVMSAARARLDAATIDALWEAGQQLSLAEAAAEVAAISLSPTRADAVG